MKKTIRKQILEKRRSLCPEEIEEKSREIEKNLFSLPFFKRARTVFFYLALPEEVQTYSMIKKCLKMGKRVGVPVVDLQKKEIVPVEIKNSACKLINGPFGVKEPDPSSCFPLPLEEIELVIVPGVAFDLQGGRIGFGGGFYDRFLRKLSPEVIFVALSFSCQIVTHLPCEGHDVPVNYIVTEDGVITCRNQSKGG
ncbi:5-formyltetrahydrofolate cyclo-ligase [Candidatus Aerophobetes bacterium]|nr:5-formyltetrahydrofolate cyclo-ligase [Candidatus Aerophobetes bacterium]